MPLGISGRVLLKSLLNTKKLPSTSASLIVMMSPKHLSMDQRVGLEVFNTLSTTNR